MKKYVTNERKRKVVKKTLQMSLFIVLLNVVTIGCVKQSNCEGCMNGTLIIFNEDNENEKENYPTTPTRKVRAKIILDGDSSYYHYGIGISGTIPLNYRKKDTSSVCVNLKTISNLTVLPIISKIECIENIE